MSLFLDLFSGVLSYSSEETISSSNEENDFSGKERLRRGYDKTFPTGFYWNESMSPDEEESLMEQDSNSSEPEPFSIKTYVHVFYKEDTEGNIIGYVSDDMIDEQIKVLNAAFEGRNLGSEENQYYDCNNTLESSSVETPFRFKEQKPYTCEQNDAWHDDTKLKYQEMTQAHRTGGCEDLHIFITGGWDDDAVIEHGEKKW